MFRFINLSFVVALAAAQTPFLRCPSLPAATAPISVNLDSCRALPCQQPQNRPAAIRTSFRLAFTVSSMRTAVTALVRSGNQIRPVNVNLGNQATTCNFLTSGRCPLSAGQTTSLTITVPLSSFAVNTEATLEVLITSLAPIQRPAICFQVPVRVVGPRVEIPEGVPLPDGVQNLEILDGF